ncbi:MAG: type II toxin-antitoxin system VapC family toxin [Candidatus Nitrotoga sp.]
MKVFLDTSAFAKRYVAEQKSDKVMKLCQQADSLIVSVICLPELISTLSRLVREKKLTKTVYRKLKNDAIADWADVDVCQITPTVLVSVVSLLESYPLRAMDAMHVACALAVEPDIFVSTDRRQLSAVKKAGLKIVDVS